MDAPVPFVLTGEDGVSLVVAKEAREALRKVDKPVVVVSVVGMYRTGKSFLLNRLMDRTDGFPLGSTVEAKTKGIWMWVTDFPGDPSQAMVLLDTEGLHDPEKGSKTHDAQIFTLAVLLSSILVYNSKGTIDASSLDGLHLATELTGHITMKADSEEETGEDFAKFFPTLVWAVRDHHLELEVDGEKITANQYLENCLTMKKSRRSQDVAYNNIRETIRDFFKERYCFVFPLPTAVDNLKNLDNMQLNELDPNFIKAGDKFAKFVAESGVCKMVKGKALTGGMYVTLAEQYVEAIVTGNVNIESAYDSMIKTENMKSLQEAVESYKAEMSTIQLPVELDTLNKANTKAQATATEIFLKTAVNSHKNQEYFNSMSKELEKQFEALTETNMKVSQEKCLNILKRLYGPLENKVANGNFTCPGGHHSYKVEVEEMERHYSQVSDKEKGPCGQVALLKFRKEKVDPHLSHLLQTDNVLTEEQKKKEELKIQNENAARQYEVLENQNNQLQKHQNDMKVSYENMLQQQQDEYAKQHREDMENLEKNRKQESEERERLMREGFKEQADLMKEQMQGTLKMMQEREDRNNQQQAEMMKSFSDQLVAMNERSAEQMKQMSEAISNIDTGCLIL